MFLDDFDRTIFCNRLAKAIDKYAWTLVAFVLMPTHFHFVLEVLDNALQPGMRDFFGPYAQEFNRRHGRWGHLRGDPYKLRTIHDDADLANNVRYVLRNPVRATLCAKPEDWIWSSWRGTSALDKAFPFVDDRAFVSFFDEDRTRALPQMRVFVQAG
jgi:REP element-mobilizing transposase RayT